MNRKTIGAHRVAYELATGEKLGKLQVDHICFNRACQNAAHLRKATAKQQGEHRQGANRRSESGIRGVTYDKRKNRWYARVGHKGKQLYVGTFKTKGEAERAVIAARKRLFTHNDLDRKSPSYSVIEAAE